MGLNFNPVSAPSTSSSCHVLLAAHDVNTDGVGYLQVVDPLITKESVVLLTPKLGSYNPTIPFEWIYVKSVNNGDFDVQTYGSNPMTFNYAVIERVP